MIMMTYYLLNTYHMLSTDLSYGQVLINLSYFLHVLQEEALPVIAAGSLQGHINLSHDMTQQSFS